MDKLSDEEISELGGEKIENCLVFNDIQKRSLICSAVTRRSKIINDIEYTCGGGICVKVPLRTNYNKGCIPIFSL